jgi:hypothetical protein
MKKEENGAGATCRYHEGHEARIATNEKRLGRHDEVLIEIQRRLPAWASLLMTVMGIVLGALASLAAAGIWGG